MTGTAHALTVTGLSLSFGGLSVIRGLDLSIRKASRTGIIGPNGAGKTTLFNLISGVYKPTTGKIRIENTDITDLPVRSRIKHGIVRSFQNIRLVPHLTVYENLLLGKQAAAVTLADGMFEGGLSSALPVWAESVCEDLHLLSFIHTPVSELSYGTRKRVDLARALVANPKILLLDEPAAGLNDVETESLRLYLMELSRRELTIIVIEHDMTFVDRLCDHVVALNFGEKIAEGPLDSVRADERVREAYLGTS